MVTPRSDREAHILEKLSQEGMVSVNALANELRISKVTVRSTLRKMEEQGLLARTHGGAHPSSIQNVLSRVEINAQAKERIAQAAARMVKDNDRIMIEAGTTTAGIPRHLSHLTGVQIVTNSTLVFNQARLNPNLRVIITGGAFHRGSESMVGPLAKQAISKFNVRLAFVGTDGFSLEHGITTQFAEGAEIVQAMSKQAEQTWLLSDSSKYGKTGFVNVIDFTALTGIITDDNLPTSTVKLFQKEHKQIQIV